MKNSKNTPTSKDQESRRRYTSDLTREDLGIVLNTALKNLVESKQTFNVLDIFNTAEQTVWKEDAKKKIKKSLLGKITRVKLYLIETA